MSRMNPLQAQVQSFVGTLVQNPQVQKQWLDVSQDQRHHHAERVLHADWKPDHAHVSRTGRHVPDSDLDSGSDSDPDSAPDSDSRFGLRFRLTEEFVKVISDGRVRRNHRAPRNKDERGSSIASSQSEP